MNSKRIKDRLIELGKIGQTVLGGTTRHSYTSLDLEACKLLESWMIEAGLEVSYDAVGNLIGKKIGTNLSEKPIALGSHFDSVKEGGIYDGCLGIIGAIEIAEMLKQQTFDRTLIIIGFRDEEGYYSKGMVGSKAVAGILRGDDLYDTNELGEVLQNKINECGYHACDYENCVLDLKAYLECHIEQGRVLDELNIPVGIVLGIVQLEMYKVKFIGQSGHAGATPMSLRDDPVVIMSQWIESITQKVKTYKDMVCTIGKIQTFPGSVNVICSEVEISLDIRSPYPNDIEEIITEFSSWNNVLLTPCVKLPGLLCHQKIIDSLKNSAHKLKVPYHLLFSGAGHDAMNFKNRCPVGMVFVRSIKGISHHKDELSLENDYRLALEVLLNTTKELLCS